MDVAALRRVLKRLVDVVEVDDVFEGTRVQLRMMKKPVGCC